MENGVVRKTEFSEADNALFRRLRHLVGKGQHAVGLLFNARTVIHGDNQTEFQIFRLHSSVRRAGDSVGKESRPKGQQCRAECQFSIPIHPNTCLPSFFSAQFPCVFFFHEVPFLIDAGTCRRRF